MIPANTVLALRSVLRFLWLLGALFFFTGCLTSRYKMAREGTPPAVAIDRTFPAHPLVVASLHTQIVYKGPGSWKREAFWDEYVLTLTNQGDQVLTINGASLIDSDGVAHACGAEPWKIEKKSKALMKNYRAAGLAIVRNAAPVVIIVGGGAAIGGNIGYIPDAVAGGMTAAVIALPIYYLTVITINHYDKVAIEAEFNRRRLGLPLTLAPGETRTGSFFFPMVLRPRTLSLSMANGSASEKSELPLEYQHGLEAKDPTPSISNK